MSPIGSSSSLTWGEQKLSGYQAESVVMETVARINGLFQTHISLLWRSRIYNSSSFWTESNAFFVDAPVLRRDLQESNLLNVDALILAASSEAAHLLLGHARFVHLLVENCQVSCDQSSDLGQIFPDEFLRMEQDADSLAAKISFELNVNLESALPWNLFSISHRESPKDRAARIQQSFQEGWASWEGWKKTGPFNAEKVAKVFETRGAKETLLKEMKANSAHLRCGSLLRAHRLD